MFEYLAIGIRFFQGSGDIILQVTCYSLVTSTFTEDLMKYISYIELTVGIGLSLGPALGSVVYPYLEFEGTMYFFGGLNFLAMCICYWCIPDSLGKTMSSK